jgi:hypothetical protein
MQLIKYITSILGFFLLFPFVYLPLGVVNIKIDDFIVIILFVLLIWGEHLKFNFKLILTILFFIYLLVYGFIIRRYSTVESFDNYPLIRIIGIVLYFLTLVYLNSSKQLLEHFFKYCYLGAKFTFALIICNLMYDFLLGYVTYSNIYSIKDSLRSLGTFNPNSYGALMILGAYFAYKRYKDLELKIDFYWCIAFLLIPFIIVIRRDIVGISCGILYLIHLRFPKYLIQLIYIFVIIGLCIGALYLINDWNSDFLKSILGSRWYIYNSAIEAINFNFWGYGIGSETELLWRNYVSHNSLLSLCIEFGVYNSIIMIILFLSLFFYSRAIEIRFFLIIFFVESLFGNGLHFYKYHYIFFFLVLNNTLVNRIYFLR